ncbi:MULTISPECIES: (2Fe-2S)-binding protein [Roseomonadaceae]|uniref:(2Fe-2S)-binding protein n=1 Tax=Falsiroseomonas oleicola TaxID=2801474 RepID=A0ABS6H527_9PROT|nr:(2Fe-2S)-binding protein [Roseomonas oleicola]MBU8543784.1 (2Fe-2S)-binding protein [Roseomonas oleicola]
MTRLCVNGETHDVRCEDRDSLALVLRDALGLTATRIGCQHGSCGACNVLLEDVPVRGCLVPAALAEGQAVTTLEGLRDDAVMIRLRAAFTAHHALQCGYCTAGMLIAARDLILRGRAGSAAEVRAGLAGQLCRCTGYDGIVAAVLAAQ